MAADERFDVVLRGFTAGHDESPAAGLQRVFGLDATAATKLLVRLPRTVQKNVPRVRAEYFRRALVLIGANVEVRGRDGRAVLAEVPMAGPAGADAIDANARQRTSDGGFAMSTAPTQLAQPAPRATDTSTLPEAVRPPPERTIAWSAAPAGTPNSPAAVPDALRAPANPTLPEGKRDDPIPAPALQPPSAAVSALAATPRVFPMSDPTFALAPPPVAPAPAPASSSSLAPLGFGPSSRTVVDTSQSDLPPASSAEGWSFPPRPADPMALSLPPPSAVPLHPSGPPGVGPMDALDWLKLASPYATHVEQPSAPIPTPEETPSDDAADPFDRFRPLQRSTVDAPTPTTPPKERPRATRPARGSPAAPIALPRAAAPERHERAAAPASLAPTRPAAPTVEPVAARVEKIAPARDAREGPQPPAELTAGPRVGGLIPLDARSFWSTLGEAVALPFQGHGLYWMFGITVWSIFVGLLGLAASFTPMLAVGLIVGLVAQSSLLAFAADFYKVCMWVPATGDKVVDRPPSFDPVKVLDLYIKSGLHLISFSVLSAAPLLWWGFRNLTEAMLTDPNALVDFAIHPVTWLLLVLPGFYWPMGIGVTALQNDFGAIWNLALGFRGIRRAPLEYLAIVVLGMVAFVASWIGLALFGFAMGVPGALFQSTIGFPLAASHGVMGALMGHLVRAKPDLFD